MVKKAGIAFLSFLLFCSLSVFGVGFVMNRTLLSPDFVIAQVDRLDVPALAGEALRGQIPLEEIPGEMEFIVEAVDDTIADLEPWIKQQADTAVHAGYDYLLGETESLSIVIDLAPVKDSLRESVGEFAGLIPATFEINESMIPPDIMAQIEQARLYVGYLLLAYKISIGVMIGSIVGLAFLHRRVRSAARSIGIPFLISGIGGLVVAMLVSRFAAPMIAQVPSTTFQTWMPQVLNDLFAPMRTLGIWFMAVGIALLIVSVVYKRRKPSS